jgi:hypothetical protein
MGDEKKAVEHKTSLAVWDQDSPVVIGRTARMKVGAKCSAGCVLKDHVIEIRNQTGASIVRAALGPEPWPGTTGLYWVEIEFSAPVDTGAHVWAVSSAHGDAFSNFTFIAVPPPEHTLTIHVRDKESQAALAEAEVRLGVYRASSNDRGVAAIELPTGSFSLSVWRVGYEQFSTTLDVSSSVSLDVELAVEVEPQEQYWM